MPQSKNTCKACKGSRFTSKGLCRSCEYTCTQDSHEAYKADLATFKARTVRHRFDHQPEYDIDLFWGDCPCCGSTLAFDLATLRPMVTQSVTVRAPECYVPHPVVDEDAKAALEEYQRATMTQRERLQLGPVN